MKIFRLKRVVHSLGRDTISEVKINAESIESIEQWQGNVTINLHNHSYVFHDGDYGLDDLLLEFAGLGLATFTEKRLLEAKVQAEWEEMEGDDTHGLS